MSKREVPFSPIPLWTAVGGDDHDDLLFEPRGPRIHETRPENQFAALLECQPREEPEWSREELLPLRDVLVDALDALDARERFVFDLIASERLSRRDASLIMSLSKSQVDRIYHQACERLRTALQDHPLIKEYLTR